MRVQNERDQVVKRHQVEREALQQQQRDAAKQLEVRQKAKREAALANEPTRAMTLSERKKLEAEQEKNRKKDKK